VGIENTWDVRASRTQHPSYSSKTLSVCFEPNMSERQQIDRNPPLCSCRYEKHECLGTRWRHL